MGDLYAEALLEFAGSICSYWKRVIYDRHFFMTPHGVGDLYAEALSEFAGSIYSHWKGVIYDRHFFMTVRGADTLTLT